MKQVVIILNDDTQLALLADAINIAIYSAQNAKQRDDFKHLKKHIGAHYINSELLQQAILNYVLNSLKPN